jgi:hypothetical protein
MPQFAECLVFEWGYGFFVLLIVVFLVVLAFLLFLVWFFGLRQPAPTPTATPEEIGYDKFTLRGPFVRPLAVLVAIGLIGWGLYWGYDKARTTYEVAFNTASAPPAELETLRDKFQQETQATLTIRDRAKKFLVSGKFEGACAIDMFESICRHYNDQIVCNSSKWNRTLEIDKR